VNGPKLLIWGLVGALLAAVAIALVKPATPVRDDVDGGGARKAIAAGARVIDVRTAGEFSVGHLPGAENVPIDTLTQVAGSWDRKTPVLVYCATGARSLNAAQWLSANGFERVYNLEGGIVAWDGEVAKGPRPAAVASGAPSASGLPVLYEFYSDT
jgi:rhodanese-related sulfurtransferase